MRFGATGGIRRMFGSVLVCATASAGCGGGGATPGAPRAVASPKASPTAVASATPGAAAFPTATQKGTVSLPSGTNLSLGSLTVVNSLGTTSVAANGTFAIRAYSDGPQFTLVVDAKGSPVLMGFVGGSTTTLAATSTAVAMAYFGTGCYALTNAQRTLAPRIIAEASEVGPLAAAISKELAMNPDAFAKADAPVAAALSTFVASVQSAANASLAARRLRTMLSDAGLPRRAGVLVNASTAPNGLGPIIEFPTGIHIQNTIRRPADLYVDRVSYVDSTGASHQDGASLTPQPIAVPATNGVQNGLVSTISDLIDGTVQTPSGPVVPAAYGPVNSDSIQLPLVSGAKSTTYLLTAVGPGLLPGAFSKLTTARATDAAAVSVKFLVTDFIVPLALSIALPLADIDEIVNSTGFETIATDLVNELIALPQIATAASQGKMGDALFLAYQQISQSGSALEGSLQLILNYAIRSEGLEAEEAALNFGEHYLTVVAAADEAQVAFDGSTVAAALAISNVADQWTAVVTPDAVTLTPATSTVSEGGTQTLTAAVPDAGSSNAAFAYTWSNTAKFGHITDGLAGHTDNFTSSHASVTYTAGTGSLGTDGVGVSVAYIDGNQRDAVNSASAQVKVVAAPESVTISPSGCHDFGTTPGSLTYTATATNVPQGETPLYGWQFGSSGDRNPTDVTFTDPGATQNPTYDEWIGPSNVVSIDVTPSTTGGVANQSIQVQLFNLNADGKVDGPSTFVAAHAFFSFGILLCSSGSI